MKNKSLWIIGAIVLVLIIIGTIYSVKIIKDIHSPLIKPSEFENMFYHVSPCNQEDKGVFANITIKENEVTLHQKVSYVCCANITLRYEINGTTLNIYEDNKGQICKCICNYEIGATINVEDITEVKVYGIYYPEVHPYELLGEYPTKNKTCAKEGEQFSKVYKNEYPEKCCDGLTEWDSGFDTSIVVNETCVYTGLLAGSPVGTCIKCGDDICGLNETICNCPGDCKDLTCQEEGQIKTLYTANCCDGLDKISGIVESDGTCGPVPSNGEFVCSDCGNGICESWENKCNCPEDCS